MAAFRNCRNCKHADWLRDGAGRKRFGNYASCTAPVTLPVTLPLSISKNWRVHDAMAVLEGPRAVHNNENVEINCPAWEPEK